MGIIVNETITLDNGLTANNYYVSLGHGMIDTRKNSMGHKEGEIETRYVTSGIFKKWISKEVSTNNSLRPFDSTPVYVSSNTAPIESAYKILYDKVKEGITNYVDDI